MRKIFPCYFGSALKVEGVDSLVNALDKYTIEKNYSDKFAARVYKITRDEQNNRLTHMKITGGSIKVKDVINGEKVNQIRIYSGNKYETVNEIYAGQICAVTGFTKTQSGQRLGEEREYKNYLRLKKKFEGENK